MQQEQLVLVRWLYLHTAIALSAGLKLPAIRWNQEAISVPWDVKPVHGSSDYTDNS